MTGSRGLSTVDLSKGMAIRGLGPVLDTVTSPEVYVTWGAVGGLDEFFLTLLLEVRFGDLPLVLRKHGNKLDIVEVLIT